MSNTVVEGTDPLLGRKVAGRYTVMRRIARGGMGVVYLAVQEPLGRAVALKVIRSDAAQDADMQRRFEREAKAASQLSHPNIVTVFDYGRTEDGSLFLAMELVDGETLRDALKRRGPFTLLESLTVVDAVLGALARAHAAGMVHRDLKPENVMLPKASGSTVGTVAAKVLDFGLAKPHDPQGQQLGIEPNITQAGGFVGTPGYAAPEQAHGEPENPRQDLYALGIVWWEMLTGAHPFPAPTPMKVLARQLVEDPPQLPPMPGLSAPIANLLRRLLARDPLERPENALKAIDELRAARTATDSADSSVDTVGAGAPITPRAALPVTVAPPARGPAASDVFDSPARSTIEGRSRVVPVVLGACAAALIGAVVAVMTTRVEKVVTDATADAGAAADDRAAPLVDAGPPVVQLVFLGVPRYVAMRSLIAALEGAQLSHYTPEESTALVLGGDASRLAELLQGRALDTPSPLVLEVVEVSGPRVTLRAVVPEEASALADAGPGALDAGPIDAVVAPDGLGP